METQVQGLSCTPGRWQVPGLLPAGQAPVLEPAWLQSLRLRETPQMRLPQDPFMLGPAWRRLAYIRSVTHSTT